jgi:hypothetical protein
MSKNEIMKKLQTFKTKEVKMKEKIIHSCSSATPFAGCSGQLMNIESGESWEDIIALINLKDKYGRPEEMWVNAKDIEGIA